MTPSDSGMRKISYSGIFLWVSSEHTKWPSNDFFLNSSPIKWSLLYYCLWLRVVAEYLLAGVLLSFVVDVRLSTSLFIFHLISFSPHFIVHVSSQFRQSTLHCSCFIVISFSSQSISFISSITVHLVHICLIWLHSYYMIIQLYCQFHISVSPVSGN